MAPPISANSLNDQIPGVNWGKNNEKSKRRKNPVARGGLAYGALLRHFYAGASNRGFARSCFIPGKSSGLWARSLLRCANHGWHSPCEWTAPTAGRKVRPGNPTGYPRIQEGGIR
jgi:hypothetical protein